MRIATHGVFRSLVESAGLEFYPLAGDPRVLMDYMLRSGGHMLNPRRLECVACGHLRLCPECVPEHAAHLKRPCRYVGWEMRPDLGLVAELSDLVGDAATALRAGFDELVSKTASRSTRSG